MIHTPLLFQKHYLYTVKNEIRNLKKGDKIRIVAPAKTIDKSFVFFAKNLLEEKGYIVEIGDNCLGSFHFFSGTTHERTSDFQNALDDDSVDAILCARGGYGCVQIVDSLQWASFLRNPKWIIGFSDVTFLHSRIQQLEQKSIHGTTPLNFQTNTPEAIQSLFNVLEGKQNQYNFESCKHNQTGLLKGEIVGGNLSILFSLLGTDDQIDYTDKILFFEDLCEALYSIDRMMYAFKKAGIFDKIKGLVVGGMTQLKDSEPPYGMDYKEIIKSHFLYNNLPICFDFPSGHIEDNRAIIIGGQVEIEISKEKVIFKQ